MSEIGDIIDDLALLLSRVDQSIHNRTFDDLVANEEAYDALTYRLAMIGETCKKLPSEIKARHPHLPWREMATFRNFASHDYFGVDAYIVWQASMNLDPIKDMMREEVKRLHSD